MEETRIATDPARGRLEGLHRARYFHPVEGGKLQCDLCPRACKLGPNQRGLCFVRAREGDRMVLTTYGRSSGFCVDPIEKKPLNHFLPGSAVFSFGTAGCNLTCKFCQNWDISKSREMQTLADAASPEHIAEVAANLGCRSVAYTYNDPVIFLEYAVDTAQACQERGIRSVAVTAGYICEAPRREFFRHIDAANIDLKCFDEKTYYEVSGAHLHDVLDTLRYLRHETKVWFELTTLLIPGMNDSNAEIEAECRWIAEELGPDVPLHFSAFHPDYKMRDVPPTPPATLLRAREIALSCGLHYVYTGNVHDPKGQSTYCRACGATLIGRDWYQLSTWTLTPDGSCANCGARCAGVFDAQPGDWGARRLPVNMTEHIAGASL